MNIASKIAIVKNDLYMRFSWVFDFLSKIQQFYCKHDYGKSCCRECEKHR